MHFGRRPFTCIKSLNDLESGTSVGRFSSDGAAGMAVEGLRLNYHIGDLGEGSSSCCRRYGSVMSVATGVSLFT